MQGTSVIRLVILVLFTSCMAVTALNLIPANAQSPCDWVVDRDNLNEAEDV